jgi:hypothetical protein
MQRAAADGARYKRGYQSCRARGAAAEALQRGVFAAWRMLVQGAQLRRCYVALQARDAQLYAAGKWWHALPRGAECM